MCRKQPTCKSRGLIRGHGSEVLQITLVTDQHDDNIGVSMVSKFLQPATSAFKSIPLRDVVNHERTNSPTIVPSYTQLLMCCYMK